MYYKESGWLYHISHLTILSVSTPRPAQIKLLHLYDHMSVQLFFFYYFFMILNAEGTFFTLHLFGNTALKHLRR